MTENSLGGMIPEQDRAVRSCHNDCIARAAYQSLEVDWHVHYWHDEDTERSSLFSTA